MPSASYCARCRGRCRERAFTPDRYEDDGRGGIRIVKSNAGMLEAIRRGDRVTIVDRFGQSRTGRAVMRGPVGWVLNMGGPHGTPRIATDENIVKIRPTSNPRARRRNPPRRRRAAWRGNPGGPNVNLLLGVGAIAVGAWLLFRTPAGGGPSLWQSMTGPSYNSGVVTVPGAGGTTIGPSVLGTVGSTIVQWLGTLG